MAAYTLRASTRVGLPRLGACSSCSSSSTVLALGHARQGGASSTASLPALSTAHALSPRPRPLDQLRIAARSASGLHTSARSARSDDPGGKPNDGSHRTIYDDFFNLLESPEAQPIVVKSMSSSSITLDDGLVIHQPAIFLNGQVYLWDPPTLDVSRASPAGTGWEAWSREIWRLFEVVEPKPEMLLFGTGESVCPPPPHVKSYLHSLGIQMDVQSTRNACSTYNLLSEEGRRVAAALIPPHRLPTRRVPNDQKA